MGSIKNRFPNTLTIMAVVGLTLISLACCIYLSSQGDLNSVQQDLYKTCSTTWKIGFAAIVYLIWRKFPKEIL
jgi:hypothetical protein